MDVLRLISVFRLYPGLKMTFEHNSVRKNLFLSACFCSDCRLSLHEMDQKLKFCALIGYGNSHLESVFRYSKYSDYTQYYMMLLEQFDHIVAEDLATVIWLDEEQILACLVTWLDYFFAFT